MFLLGQNCGSEVALNWTTSGSYLDTGHWLHIVVIRSKGYDAVVLRGLRAWKRAKTKAQAHQVISVPKCQTDRVRKEDRVHVKDVVSSGDGSCVC